VPGRGRRQTAPGLSWGTRRNCHTPSVEEDRPDDEGPTSMRPPGEQCVRAAGGSRPRHRIAAPSVVSRSPGFRCRPGTCASPDVHQLGCVPCGICSGRLCGAACDSWSPERSSAQIQIPDTSKAWPHPRNSWLIRIPTVYSRSRTSTSGDGQASADGPPRSRRSDESQRMGHRLRGVRLIAACNGPTRHRLGHAHVPISELEVEASAGWASAVLTKADRSPAR
jgi:hypothetical protein